MRHPLLPTPGIPWQDFWLSHYDCDTPSLIPYPRVPLSTLLEAAAERFPDHAGCTLYGRATSYAELRRQSRSLSRSLQKLGVGPGRCVGMLLPNIPEYLVAMQATWLASATVLQLSPLMVAEEIQHWLETTGCHVVIALDLLAPNVVGAIGHGPLEHVVLTSLVERLAIWKGLFYRIERVRRGGALWLRDRGATHLFETLLHEEPLEHPVPVDPAQDVAVLAPTGGTTASPKAVELTHRNLLANAMQLRLWCGGEDGTGGILGALPFFHAYGLSVSLLTSLAGASTIHLYPRFEKKGVLGVIEKQKPTFVPAVPAMLLEWTLT